jgi:hypothetical protein
MKIVYEISLGLWLSRIEQAPPESSGIMRETLWMNVVKFKEA